MKDIKAIIFDMDGVILDSESLCDKIWAEIAKEMNISNISLGINECRGRNISDTKIILKRIYGDDFDSELFTNKSIEKFHEVENTSGIPLLPYVKETLDYLKPKYRIALASSTKGDTVRRQLNRVGVLDYFETLTTGDMVIHSKPNPEIYQMSCSSLQLSVDECIAIEDSPNGIKSAYNAGLRTVMIPDRMQPTEEIKPLLWNLCDSLKGLIKIL
ncbi:MAG: HAD family phosphatase [Treponema sp.]|jgi:HAD superfamily hydrolase (TIGR01509 family)|nr:HAD family phosphatase [Treponema sp.]